ncbi:hypothetical protein BS78_01G438400 [Paspalum vaginatum]|nr:hypothetical protein BS78_01G438400 [Paspalum vaginatum]
MALEQSLHMNKGEGEASYARNSTNQNAGQNRMNPLIHEAVTSLWKYTNCLKKVVITDLGCSAGPNSLTLVKTAVDAIFRYCSDHKEMLPEIAVLLNDLPDNDFNNVAKALSEFQQSTQGFGPVVTAMVPGSFYKRLFTSNSVHLVLSSNSLNWLSQVPEYLKKSRIPMYDSDEGLRQARRPLVVQACGRQFRKDLTHFLNARAQELVPIGQMVLSLVGRSSRDSTSQSIQPWDFAFIPLKEMAARVQYIVALDYVPCLCRVNGFLFGFTYPKKQHPHLYFWFAGSDQQRNVGFILHTAAWAI